MTNQDSIFSPTAIFNYFMVLVWPRFSLERDIYWSLILRTNSIQCHNNPVLVPPRKIPYTVKDLYANNIYNHKTRVDIWMRMDVFPVQYETFDQTFHLMMWFFQFIIGITLNLDYVLWHIIALLVWIGIWTKLRIYRVPTDPVRWSCRGFGSSGEHQL